MGNDFLILPKIEIKPVKQTIGKIYWSIDNERKLKVIKIEEIKLSNAKYGKIYFLENEEKYLLVDYKTKYKSSDLDGILLQSPQGLKWLFSKKLQQCKEKIDANKWDLIKDEIRTSWENSFHYFKEVRDEERIISNGLRGPQLGALHSIASHWTINEAPATIVMPTGTGKTEVMLSTLASQTDGKLLVIVPSKALRDQTAKKFINFGILKNFGLLNYAALNPIVGVVKKRPKTLKDFDIFDKCNVVVAVVSSISQGTGLKFLEELSNKFSYLFIDEAHHVAASSWNILKEKFVKNRILQFTATPFRTDGKVIGGKIIYNYPLALAQRDKYFRKIHFIRVYESDPEMADETIATRAVNELKEDLSNGLDHIMMARCSSIKKAEEIQKIYAKLAPQLKPTTIHSKLPNYQELIDDLEQGKYRIVICVDMLGEGYDLPKLKIAALHNAHKSLAVFLQFVGRFTRVSEDNIGEAKVIANIAEDKMSDTLEKLYSEDADWNLLLPELSSEAIKEHAHLINFINESKRLDTPDEESVSGNISPQYLYPKFSTVIYRANKFIPESIRTALESSKLIIEGMWLNKKENVLYFITRSAQQVDWSTYKSLKDELWDFVVIYFDKETKLLYIHSTNKDMPVVSFASSVSEDSAQLIKGEDVFRSLYGVTRLKVNNLGLTKPNNRNKAFSMYSGADVEAGMSLIEKLTSIKSNIATYGFSDGYPISIGCSRKGKIWSRGQDNINNFLVWCRGMGAKVANDKIDLKELDKNYLVPKTITELPKKELLLIDWNERIFSQYEDRISLSFNGNELPLHKFEISNSNTDFTNKEILFDIKSEVATGTYALKLGGQEGFQIIHKSGQLFGFKSGALTGDLVSILLKYPPVIYYIDGSELNGDELIEQKNREIKPLLEMDFDIWDWKEIDIKKEVMWKNGKLITNSIQYKVVSELSNLKPDIIFNDDGAGEYSDVIFLKEDDDYIDLRLIHCKFSDKPTAGRRVKDLYEICGQAVRSSKRTWDFEKVLRHITSRDKDFNNGLVKTRFILGGHNKIKKLRKAAKFKEVKVSIIMVQPGVSKSKMTEEQAMLIFSANTFIFEFISSRLQLICSS